MKKIIAVLAVLTLASSVFAGELDNVGINGVRNTNSTPGNYEVIPHTPNLEQVPSLLSIQINGQTIVDVDITGVNNWDGPGSPNNETTTLDLNALSGGATGDPATITAIGWDVNIAPIGASWFNEAVIGFNPDGGVLGLQLTPGTDGEAAAFPGEFRNYNSGGGLVVLADIDFDGDGNPDGLNAEYSTGTATFEFFESFDDVTDEIDSSYVKGVPEPASASLLILAAMALLGIRRK